MNNRHILTSIAALVMGAGLTGCSHDFGELTAEQEVTEVYNHIFIENFGQPAANHNWGFDAPAVTRGITRAENANANEWADPNKAYGGWIVPDPLTEGQKERVKAYFQANPNLGFQDPHLRNFFVQQVYKGGTAPGSYSTEIVIAADSSQYDSDNMNLMTVGESAVHINNFNRGDCTERTDVLDNGGNANDGPFHTDKIMLMVNIDDTSCFGYHETGSSNEDNETGQHNDRAALVAASVIDSWASTHGNPGEPVVDKWNRSFLGYDLAIKEGDQIFSGEIQKYTSGMNMGYDGLYYADDDIVYFDYDESWNRLMPEGMSDEMKDAKDNALRILDSNTNFYSGIVVKLNDSDLRVDLGGKVLVNMVRVNQLIADGYYPVSGSAFKEWIKPTHSYDGYYSDWIVTLTEAQPMEPSSQEEEEEEEEDDDEGDTWGDWVRIIAEDLSVTQRSDFDFNDVVFDVRINTSNTKAQIKLKAAGGTLPLTIGWDGDEMTSYSDYEVHNMYDVATNIMVNTHAKNGVDGKKDVVRTLTGTFNSANDVKVMVQKRGEWHEITAHTGEPASKIQVKPTFNWCNERKNIGDVYNGKRHAKSFNDYVSDPSVASDWYE